MTGPYAPAPGRLVLPLGLPVLPAHPGARLVLATRGLEAGLVIGFVCLNPELTVHELKLGHQGSSRRLLEVGDGFPSELAQGDPRVDPAGLLLQPHVIQISQDISVTVANLRGTLQYVRAYFLIEVEQTKRAGGQL